MAPRVCSVPKLYAGIKKKWYEVLDMALDTVAPCNMTRFWLVVGDGICPAPESIE